MWLFLEDISDIVTVCPRILDNYVETMPHKIAKTTKINYFGLPVPNVCGLPHFVYIDSTLLEKTRHE